MKKLFLSSLGINILVMAINLITGIISARYLGPEGRGELAAATRWSGLFTVIFTIGLPGAVIYLGKQYPEKQRDYFGVYLVLGSLLGVAGLIIGQLLLPVLLAKQPKQVVDLASLAMMAIPFTLLADGLIGSLQTLNQFRKVLSLRILSPTGQLAIIMVLLLSGTYTVHDFIITSILWSFAIFSITFIWVYRSVRPRLLLGNLFTLSKDLLRRGGQIYAGFVVSTFGGNLDQLIISLFLTTYTLGLYSVSSSVATILPSVIIGAVGTYLFSKLMDFGTVERRSQVERIHGTLFYATLGLALAGGVLLPFVLPFVYGSEYTSAVFMGQILLISAPLNVAYVVLCNFLSAEGKFHYVTYAEITAMSGGLLTTAILLHWFHGVGAAMGVVTIGVLKWSFVMLKSSKLGISRRRLLGIYPDSYVSLIKAVLRRGQPLHAKTSEG